MNTRAAAATILTRVISEGHSLSDSLPTILKKIHDSRDQAFVQALCYGVCRWYFYLDAIVKMLLDKPLKQKDQDIHILIMIGLYQLIDMRIPDYAAVGETVSATQSLKKIWAKNLVNGVLRQYQRRKEEFDEKIKNNITAQYAHPEWFIKKVKQDWPEDWQTILEANNQHPPLSLRVNQKIKTRESYLEDISADIISETASGIILKKAIEVDALPGFYEGHVSVQDGAAQLAAELLMLQPGQRVLDACAAPGGKTAHILECESVELIAIDRDKERLASVHENLLRLKLSAKLICADAGDLNAWWDGQEFDRILLDAPCSASGVIRRHPDIKLLRRASDISALAKEQQRLLNSIWQTLKPGGMLIYSTCSIFHEENDNVIQSFLEFHPDAKEETIAVEWGKECGPGRQILPGMHHMDGFYYARLRKL